MKYYLPISSSARQHFVDANDVEWMQAHSDVELVLTAVLHQVLVATNASSFQSFTTQLFVFIRNQMNTQGKILNCSFFSSQIKYTNFWIRDTTAKPRFRVRLIFAIAVAGGWNKSFTKRTDHTKLLICLPSSWSSAHFDSWKIKQINKIYANITAQNRNLVR